MADKRKPVYTILLRNEGKKKHNSIEIFSGKGWGKSHRLFRLRVNGKWHPKGEFKLFYKSHIKNLIFNSAKF